VLAAAKAIWPSERMLAVTHLVFVRTRLQLLGFGAVSPCLTGSVATSDVGHLLDLPSVEGHSSVETKASRLARPQLAY
jgi:hypothetical protein